MKLNICISLNPPEALNIGMVEENEAQKSITLCPVSIDGKRWNLNEKFCLSELKT